MIRRPTWILLILFAISLAGAYFWQRSQGDEADQEPTPTPPALLLGLDTIQFRDLQVEDAQGARIYLRKVGGGSWIITEPHRQNAKIEAVNNIVMQLALMSPTTTLGDPPADDQIGLLKPSHIITITDEGGKDHVLQVGAVTPTQDGYYIRFNGIVYVVDKYNLDEVVGMIANPPAEIPTATATSELPAQEIITGTVTAPADQQPTGTP